MLAQSYLFDLETSHKCCLVKGLTQGQPELALLCNVLFQLVNLPDSKPPR